MTSHLQGVIFDIFGLSICISLFSLKLKEDRYLHRLFFVLFALRGAKNVITLCILRKRPLIQYSVIGKKQHCIDFLAVIGIRRKFAVSDWQSECGRNRRMGKETLTLFDVWMTLYTIHLD